MSGVRRNGGGYGGDDPYASRSNRSADPYSRSSRYDDPYSNSSADPYSSGKRDRDYHSGSREYKRSRYDDIGSSSADPYSDPYRRDSYRDDPYSSSRRDNDRYSSDPYGSRDQYRDNGNRYDDRRSYGNDYRDDRAGGYGDRYNNYGSGNDRYSERDQYQDRYDKRDADKYDRRGDDRYDDRRRSFDRRGSGGYDDYNRGGGRNRNDRGGGRGRGGRGRGGRGRGGRGRGRGGRGSKIERSPERPYIADYDEFLALEEEKRNFTIPEHDKRLDGNDFVNVDVADLFGKSREDMPDSAPPLSKDAEDEEACTVVVSGLNEGPELEKLKEYFSSFAMIRDSSIVDGKTHIVFKEMKDVQFAIEWFRNPTAACFKNMKFTANALKAQASAS